MEGLYRMIGNQVIISNKVPQAEQGEANGFWVDDKDTAGQYRIQFSEHGGRWEVRITTTTKPERTLRMTIKRFFKPTVTEDFAPEKFHDCGPVWTYSHRGFPEEIISDMSFPPNEIVHVTLEAIP
jgi:hypothetical protein